MISPHTPPGTHVVALAVDRDTAMGYIRADLQDQIPAHWGTDPDIHEGHRYVVAAIEPEYWAATGFGVRLVGRDGKYPLECFRVLDLPDSLTRLLAAKPVDQLEDA